MTVVFEKVPAFLTDRGTKRYEGGGGFFYKYKGKECDMAMGKDRVRFRLGYNYFRGDKRSAMFCVMEKAFGLSESSLPQIPTFDCTHRQYIEIICRPSQFARFMIYRDEVGITNGFKDLRADLIEAEPEKDVYDRIAEITGACRNHVKKVAQCLSYNTGDLEARLDNYSLNGISRSRAIDVSHHH